MFDINNFDEDAVARKKREALLPPTFSQEQLDHARNTAHTLGYDEGFKAGLSTVESDIQALFQQMVAQLRGLEQAEMKRHDRFIDMASLLCAEALAKVLPLALEQTALAQIEQFIATTLREHMKRQGIIIFVSPENKERLEDKIPMLLATMPHKIECTIRENKALGKHECRIEWSGGGADWDPERTQNVILEAINSHIPAAIRNNHQAPAKTASEIDGGAQTFHTDAGDAS